MGVVDIQGVGRMGNKDSAMLRYTGNSGRMKSIKQTAQFRRGEMPRGEPGQRVYRTEESVEIEDLKLSQTVPSSRGVLGPSLAYPSIMSSVLYSPTDVSAVVLVSPRRITSVPDEHYKEHLRWLASR